MTVTADLLIDIGRRAGLRAVGVCRAEPFAEAARVLRRRKREGLHGGMQFTYRNPERSTDPERVLPGAASLVVGALDFWREEPERPTDGLPYGRVASYARTDHYSVLRTALESVAEPLRAAGNRAVVVADQNHLVDRAAAHRAGIGWWGKSSNILVPGAGSMVVLGAVVTDAELCEIDPDPMPDGCGSCRQCLDGCPTGAIIAPGTVDARRCLAWLVQTSGVFDPDFRVALGDRIYGCDDCADVCPPNRVRIRIESRRAERRGRTRTESAWVSLIDMLEASDEDLTARFGRWYIPPPPTQIPEEERARSAGQRGRSLPPARTYRSGSGSGPPRSAGACPRGLVRTPSRAAVGGSRAYGGSAGACRTGEAGSATNRALRVRAVAPEGSPCSLRGHSPRPRRPRDCGGSRVGYQDCSAGCSLIRQPR